MEADSARSIHARPQYHSREVLRLGLRTRETHRWRHGVFECYLSKLLVHGRYARTVSRHSGRSSDSRRTSGAESSKRFRKHEREYGLSPEGCSASERQPQLESGAKQQFGWRSVGGVEAFSPTESLDRAFVLAFHQRGAICLDAGRPIRNRHVWKALHICAAGGKAGFTRHSSERLVL